MLITRRRRRRRRVRPASRSLLPLALSLQLSSELRPRRRRARASLSEGPLTVGRPTVTAHLNRDGGRGVSRHWHIGRFTPAAIPSQVARQWQPADAGQPRAVPARAGRHGRLSGLAAAAEATAFQVLIIIIISATDSARRSCLPGRRRPRPESHSSGALGPRAGPARRARPA